MPGEEIFYLSVSELAKRIESRKLSPVELTQMYLDRSQKFGPRFNAYARLTPEIALEQAKAAEKEIQRGHYRGPLHGIPYAAKDLLAVKGLPTTWGAKPYANQVFDYDATVIEHLNRVGAVMIGKAAMIELAGGMGYRFASASLQGEAKNPWDTKCWTCGSSSGSGALHSPSARKRGARSYARRPIAASADCALLTAASAVTALWRLRLRWTRSDR
jgi:aspartyl-tRNA(Asn)/glutamyl-tRNA(Gln) amidotransferase subunit A